MRKGAVTTTAVSWLLGICLLFGAAACTSGGGSSPTAKTSSSASTTRGATSCFEPVASKDAAAYEPVASKDAAAYVGLSLKGAESRATARHDHLIVVEEEGTCTVRALPAYIGPSLIVEVALVSGKVAAARSGYAASR
jgi:hypothetical protein